MKKSQQIKIIAITTTIGLLIPLLWNVFYKFQYDHVHHFLIIFLLTKIKIIGWDFYTIYDSAKSLNPYLHSQAGGVYFPLAYIVMLPFSFLRESYAILLYLTIFLFGFAFFNWTFLVKHIAKNYHIKTPSSYLKVSSYIFIFTCLSYPALEVIISGNLEAYLFLFLAIFLYFFLKKKYNYGIPFLSAAIAMKIYPAVFILLFFKNRLHKEIVSTVFLSLFFLLFPLFIFKAQPIESLLAFQHNLVWFDEYFVQSIRGLSLSTSFFAMFRVLNEMIGTKDYTYSSPASADFMWDYFLFTIIFFSLIILYVTLIENKTWKKVLLLTCSILLLPHVVFYYKLIYLYLPFYAFIDEQEDLRGPSPLYPIYLTIFILFFIPKEYLTLGGESISLLINPFLMVIMMIIAMIESLWERKSLP